LFTAAGAFRGQLSLALPAISWLSISWLGLCSTAVAFVLFLRGLAVLGPLRTAIITSAEPFFVAVLAALILGQPVRLATVAGGSLIAGAVLLLQRRTPAGDRN
jgi:DME family drug/metabolite transporter